MRAALGVALLVEQVELQLAGHHRVVTVRLERFDGTQQYMARVGDTGGQAFARVHADLHGGSRHAAPGQAHQAAFKRVGAAVDVTDIPDQAGVFHVVAIEGEAEDGAGQRAAALVDRQQFLAVQQLAAWHTVGVEDEQFEQFDIRFSARKRLACSTGAKCMMDSLTGAWEPRAGAVQRRQTAARRPGLVTRA